MAALPFQAHSNCGTWSIDSGLMDVAFFIDKVGVKPWQKVTPLQNPGFIFMFVCVWLIDIVYEWYD